MSFSNSPLLTYGLAMQGYSNTAPTTMPLAIAPSLEQALPSSPIACSKCLCQVRPATSRQSLEGCISWLPHLQRLPQNSVAFDPSSDLNHGAGNHPCLVAMVSACGHLGFCMQMTSFGGRGIVDKYSMAANAQEQYEQYLPLAELHTPRTNSRGVVPYDGVRMKQQTYINLDMGFWIELQHLTGRRTSSWLSGENFEVAKRAYAAAEAHRRENGGSRAKARIARRSASPPSPPPSRGHTQSISPSWAPATPFVPQRWSPPSPPPSPVKQAPSQERVAHIRTTSWR